MKGGFRSKNVEREIKNFIETLEELASICNMTNLKPENDRTIDDYKDYVKRILESDKIITVRKANLKFLFRCYIGYECETYDEVDKYMEEINQIDMHDETYKHMIQEMYDEFTT